MGHLYLRSYSLYNTRSYVLKTRLESVFRFGVSPTSLGHRYNPASQPAAYDKKKNRDLELGPTHYCCCCQLNYKKSTRIQYFPAIHTTAPIVNKIHHQSCTQGQPVHQTY